MKEYESDRKRFRIDIYKLRNSKYYELYTQKKDINGKQLRRGYEYIPENFNDWLNEYLGDYFYSAFVIYEEMCNTKRIVKEDLQYLNKIAKKYKVKMDE